MRIAPLLFIVLVMALAGATVGTAFVWVIAGVCIVALGVLFFFMVRQNQFVGPGVLLDDAKKRFSESDADLDDKDDAVVVVVRREDKVDE
jgi:hypothetical protein